MNKKRLKTVCLGRGAVLLAFSIVGYAGCWYVFDAESRLNRESSFAAVYEWVRIDPIPSSATNISISTRGTAFTREFTLQFDAPKDKVLTWLKESPGPSETVPTTKPNGAKHYEIKPGSRATKAEIFVSPNGEHVRIHTYWS